MTKLFNTISMMEFIIYVMRGDHESQNFNCLKKFIEGDFLICKLNENSSIEKIEKSDEDEKMNLEMIEKYADAGRTRSSISVNFLEENKLSFFKKMKTEKRRSFAIDQIES